MKRAIELPVKVIQIDSLKDLESEWSMVSVCCRLCKTSFSYVEETWELLYRFGSADLASYMAKPPSPVKIRKTLQVIEEFYR